MTDHSKMRLGCLAPVPTPHLPDLDTYAARMPLPEPPANIDWGRDSEWPLLANDSVGDCTLAAVMHYMQAAERWRDGVGRMATDEQTLAGYAAAAGYDPAKPESDRGALISDVMKHWLVAGFEGPGGVDKPTAYVKVDVSNPQLMRQALWLFGPLIVGARMPLMAQKQLMWPTPGLLTGDNLPGSWGGHCMLLTAWRPSDAVELVTWGEAKTATAGWLKAYVVEAWAVLHPTWVAYGHSPAGELASALASDIAKVSG